MHGLKGYLKAIVYHAQHIQCLHHATYCYLTNDRVTFVKTSIAARRTVNRHFYLKFSAIDTPEMARKLTNTIIAMHSSMLPPLQQDEYYWSDLIGLTIIDQHGQSLGTVSYLMATGANDVLIVQHGTKEYAIPYLPQEVITSIDLAQHVIYVNWEVI